MSTSNSQSKYFNLFPIKLWSLERYVTCVMYSSEYMAKQVKEIMRKTSETKQGCKIWMRQDIFISWNRWSFWAQKKTKNDFLLLYVRMSININCQQSH